MVGQSLVTNPINSGRHKKCARCGGEFPADLENFIGHAQCAGGIGPYCRSCVRAYRRSWRLANPAKIRASRERVKAAKSPTVEAAKRVARIKSGPVWMTAGRLHSSVRDRCAERGLPLATELRSRKFIEAWLLRQPNCECCGVEFDHGPKGGVKSDASASFDQISPGAGYDLGNVALICWRCNNIKRNYNPADLRMVAEWVAQRQSAATRPINLVPMTDGVQNNSGGNGLTTSDSASVSTWPRRVETAAPLRPCQITESPR